jgi:uncharacterized DUF497 family protein
LDERQYQIEWDEIKAAANASKQGVSFELASTVFTDPGLLTVADLQHSAIQERWFSIGLSGDEDSFCRISLVGVRATDHKSPAHFCAPGNAEQKFVSTRRTNERPAYPR